MKRLFLFTLMILVATYGWAQQVQTIRGHVIKFEDVKI